MREAAALWERIGLDEGDAQRDAHWSHPDLLPQLPADESEADSSGDAPKTPVATEQTTGIDWDAELSKLLDEGLTDGGANTGGANVDGDPGTGEGGSGTNAD